MAGILDKKCRGKAKYKEEQIGECPFSIPPYNLLFVNLYTKFEVSILNGYGDIFNEKSGEKENRINIGKNK